MKLQRLSKFIIISILLFYMLLGGCDFLKRLDIGFYTVIAEVKDSETLIGIPDVFVQIQKPGIKAVTTDNNGTYKMLTRLTGKFNVIFSKEGYISSTKELIIEEKGTYIETAFLTRLAPSVLVKPQGGRIETKTDEGKSLSVDIPAGSLKVNTNVSVTPLQGTDAPPLPKEDMVPVSTARFEPEGLQFQKPVTITLPLPFSLPSGTEISLLYFDSKNPSWKNEQSKAIVNTDGLTASAQVTHFSTYSIAVEGKMQIKEEKRESETKEIEVKFDQALIKATYDVSIDFPDGIPDGISKEFIIGLIDQHHRISPSGLIETAISYQKLSELGFNNEMPNVAYAQAPHDQGSSLPYLIGGTMLFPSMFMVSATIYISTKIANYPPIQPIKYKLKKLSKRNIFIISEDGKVIIIDMSTARGGVRG